MMKEYLRQRKLAPYKRLISIAITTVKYMVVLTAGWFFITLYLVVTK